MESIRNKWTPSTKEPKKSKDKSSLNEHIPTLTKSTMIKTLRGVRR